MEIEPIKPTAVAKKMWNVMRIVFMMIRAGISKSKLMVDFHLMLKRGNKLAGKAIGNLILHHHGHGSFTGCKFNDDAYVSSYISRKEYEFSCSNSPAFSYHHKRKHHLPRAARAAYHCDDASTVRRVLEMLNNNDKNIVVSAGPSPLTALPGFGRSPMGRQLRITDSPFPLKDDGGDNGLVDMAAEEFIKRFYKDLTLQKSMAALESPYHDSWGR